MPALAPSDIMLTFDLFLAVVFALYFALGKPRVWFRDRLGWVIFGYALAVIALLGLIVYAVLTGERVEEPVRLIVLGALGIALIAKTMSVFRERHEGRLAGARSNSIERNGLMSPSTLSLEEVKDATTIWYKMQRVLRTGVATLISILTVWAAAQLIIPDIMAELAKILPASWIAWLTGVAAAITLVAGVLTRIMAIPAVNAFLTKWLGLGSVPKSALAVESNYGAGHEVYVMPDPKADSHGR